MTTIFSVLNDIIQKKKGNLHFSPDFEDAIKNPYLFQRWLSMSSPLNSYLINETTNKLYTALENDLELWYKLYLVLIEKNPNYQKTSYIKRPFEKTDETMEKILELLQIRNELSHREVTEYLELEKTLNFDIERHKKLIVK